MNTESDTAKNKDFQISQKDIEEYKDILRQYKPYKVTDPEFCIYDNPKADINRLRATHAEDVLTQLGIDISDILAKWEME